MRVKSYAAKTAQSALAPFEIERRAVGPQDVLIEILYCGICHSDIHQARDEWGGSIFPMVPGHEIVGRVREVGNTVSKFKVDEPVGVGCFVDSCRACIHCQKGEEQYCLGHLSVTYNGTEQDRETPTFGGYSTHIVVDQDYVLRIPEHLDLKASAPLLCAGITTYSPLRTWQVSTGHHVGVLGLGGLGHMAVKIASALGARVTVLSGSPSKREDAERLGAHDFLLHSDPANLEKYTEQFDFLIDTVSAPHDLDMFLSLLRLDGTAIMLGVSPEALQFNLFSIVRRRRRIAGSLIGGIAQTQEMLDFCGEHNIVSDIELISASQINEAYERMIKSDVKYRFVIDSGSY